MNQMAMPIVIFDFIQSFRIEKSRIKSSSIQAGVCDDWKRLNRRYWMTGCRTICDYEVKLNSIA